MEALMISQTAEYALRAIAFLAKMPDDTHLTREIAAATKVPSGYLAKVMQTLVKADLVLSKRGIRGGFTLERAPDEISILDVVNAVDPLQRIRSCPLNLPEHREKLCPLHHNLDRAMADIEQALGNTTIADIMTGPDGRVPLGKLIRISSCNQTEG